MIDPCRKAVPKFMVSAEVTSDCNDLLVGDRRDCRLDSETGIHQASLYLPRRRETGVIGKG